jgi:hypothetical protein
VSNTKETVLPGLRFRLLPNPAHGHFSAALDADAPQDATMMLTDAGGKVLLQKKATLVSGFQTIPFDVKNFPAGIYTFILQTEKGRVSKPVSVF